MYVSSYGWVNIGDCSSGCVLIHTYPYNVLISQEKHVFVWGHLRLEPHSEVSKRMENAIQRRQVKWPNECWGTVVSIVLICKPYNRDQYWCLISTSWCMQWLQRKSWSIVGDFHTLSYSSEVVFHGFPHSFRWTLGPETHFDCDSDNDDHDAENKLQLVRIWAVRLTKWGERSKDVTKIAWKHMWVCICKMFSFYLILLIH